MASIHEVIERVDRVKPNAFDERDKAAWLIELDGRIVLEVTQGKSTPAVRYPEGGASPLTAPPPYDSLYDLYLSAMVDFHNREYGNYNNTMAMFNAVYDTYRKWYRRSHRPPPTGGLKLGG